MKKMLSMLRGILLALCCLLGKQVIALPGINGSPATIYAGAGIPIMNNGQTNNFRFIVSNPTVSPISGISVQTVIPAGCTVGIVAPPSGTTYNSGTGIWTFTSPLLANDAKALQVNFTYNGSSNKTLVASASFISGSTGSSDFNLLISCPIIAWTDQVTINGGNPLQFSNTAYYDSSNQYIENLTPQGVNAVFSAYRQNTPVNGTPEYFATIEPLSVPLTKYLNVINAPTALSSLTGNAPYTIVNLNGTINTALITDTPPNYLQTMITFDAATYPNGLAGVAFFINDILASINGARTVGFQDAVIVYGTNINGNQVAPVTLYGPPIYNVFSSPYSLAVGGKCTGNSTGYDCYTNSIYPSYVRYIFPMNIRSFTIRNFRNAYINRQQSTRISNIYGGCTTDLALGLTAPEAVECEQCFTYTVTATNKGETDVAAAIVQGVLPAGLTFTSATPSKGTFDPLTGIWTIGSLTGVPQETETLVMDVCATQSSITWDMVLLGNNEQTVPGDNEIQKTISVSYIVVQDDMATTLKNLPVDINWAANDSSVGGTLNFGSFSYTPTPDGTVIILSPGIIRFTPTNGFTGTATIPYTVSDSNGCEGSANIHVMVSDTTIYPPQAYNDFALTSINTPVTVPVLLNDHAGSAPLNPASVTIVTPPSHGLITNINPANGEITYAPHIGFTGVDSFVYQVCDTNGFCSQATVYLHVQGPAKPCPTVCPSDCCPVT